MLTFTITTGPAVIALLSALLFVLVTHFCWRQGMFDGADTLGIGSLFTLLFYSVGWAMPSLLIWATWATWLR